MQPCSPPFLIFFRLIDLPPCRLDRAPPWTLLHMVTQPSRGWAVPMAPQWSKCLDGVDVCETDSWSGPATTPGPPATVPDEKTPAGAPSPDHAVRCSRKLPPGPRRQRVPDNERRLADPRRDLGAGWAAPCGVVVRARLAYVDVDARGAAAGQARSASHGTSRWSRTRRTPTASR